MLNYISNLIILIFTILTTILTFIEKSQKIKWKPISRIFIGDVHDKIDNMLNKQDNFEKKLLEIENENDKREIKRLKNFICDYATEKCELGLKKSQEQEKYFDECVSDYEELLKKCNLTNGHTTQSIKLVSEYRKMELKDKYKKNICIDK